VQETWVEVLRRIDTFDDSKGSFWAFTLNWTKIVLKRHYSTSVADPAQPDEDSALRADLGSSSPEKALMLARIITELLRRVLACTRPPHEVIAFGFSKLQWKPQQIREELCDINLRDLALRLEVEYSALVRSPAIRALFRPLHDRLVCTLSELVHD